MRSADREGLRTRLGAQVQALQTHYSYPLLFHQRMEHGHIMIDLTKKGGITPFTKIRRTVACSEKTRDQRVPSQTTHHIPRMEVHHEDPVNPRGSRDCSFTVYFGVG